MPKIDLSNYEGREQAYVKHKLLEKYLSRWAYKTGSTWNPLVFVDGFAGPWGAKDQEFADASFGIAVKALNDAVEGLFTKLHRSVRGICIFVEKEPRPFAKLDAFATSHSTDQVRTKAFKGRFVENIEAIDKYISTIGLNPFRFVFLDQKGWAATPMDKLRPFVRRRPSELLFTLMTSFLTRFVDRKALTASYDSLFGRPGVIEKIRSLPKGTGQREEAAVYEYCRSLRDICGFRFVSQAVVLDPSKEKVRYFLIFATNSLHGIEVFKSAETEAAEAQDHVRHERRLKRQAQFGLPFPRPPPKSPKASALQLRYIARLRHEVVRILTTSGTSVLPYKTLYAQAMALPVVTPNDLESLLFSLEPNIKLQLQNQRQKRPSPFKNDYIKIIDRRRLA